MPFPSIPNIQGYTLIHDKVVVDISPSNGETRNDSISSSNPATQASSKETQATSLLSSEEELRVDKSWNHREQSALVNSRVSELQNITEIPYPTLTATNPEKLSNMDTLQEEGSVEYVPPAPTVADRLRQARIYLSDEDVNSDLKFVKRKEAIEQFMKDMAVEDRKDNDDVYIRVNNMLRVHSSRMQWQRTQCMPRIRHDPQQAKMRRAQVQRTQQAKKGNKPSQAKGTPSKPLPPFTLDAHKDHDEFLKKFHSADPKCTTGQELRFIEEQAFIEALGKPQLVNEFLQEKPSQCVEECYKVRAKMRGRHRAALQLALHEFASNEEQHFEGGWKYRTVRMPNLPRLERPEPEIFKALGSNQMPYDPHFWKMLYRKWYERDLPEETLLTIAKGLYKGDGLPSIPKAQELIEEQINIGETHSGQPITADFDDMWAFADNLPAEARDRRYFSMRDWVLDSSSTLPKSKEHTTQTMISHQFTSDPPTQYIKTALPGSWIPTPTQPTQEVPPSKRAHYPVQYKSLNPNSTKPSTRLPPEEIGFTSIREDSYDHTTEPPKPQERPKRVHNPVQYTSLNPSSTKPSTRLPPEEIGFTTVLEDSREHTPEIGTGEIMPQEIREWSVKKYGYILDDAPDPKERIHENMRDLPYGETPFINAYIDKYGSEQSDLKTLPIPLPQTKFALPRTTPAQKAEILANAPPRELWHQIGEQWDINRRLQLLENGDPDVPVSGKRKWWEYGEGAAAQESEGVDGNHNDAGLNNEGGSGEETASPDPKRQKLQTKHATAEPEPEKSFLEGVKRMIGFGGSPKKAAVAEVGGVQTDGKTEPGTMAIQAETESEEDDGSDESLVVF